MTVPRLREELIEKDQTLASDVYVYVKLRVYVYSKTR